MGNYNFVVDTSNFRPYDFSPAFQLLRDYRDAQYRLEDQLNKIPEENGEYVLPESAPKQYRDVMSKYNMDRDAAVDALNSGVSLTQVAQSIRNLRRSYEKDVKPIKNTVERYNKYNDKLAALGPDAIVRNRTRTLEDFYGGVNPELEYRSSKTIQATAAGVMQGIDNALTNAPEIAGSIAKQYFILKRQGIQGQQALEAILEHNPQVATEQGVQDVSTLLNALDNVYRQFAFEGNASENTQIWQQVVSGAIQGIQAPKYDTQVNHNFESYAANASRTAQNTHYKDLHEAALQEKEIKKAQAEAKGYIQQEDGTFKYDPTKVQIKEDKKDTKEDTTPYINYGGERYSIKKVSGSYKDTYDIVNLETHEIVRPNSALYNSIMDYYNGENTEYLEIDNTPSESSNPPHSVGTPWGSSQGGKNINSLKEAAKKKK